MKLFKQSFCLLVLSFAALQPSYAVLTDEERIDEDVTTNAGLSRQHYLGLVGQFGWGRGAHYLPSRGGAWSRAMQREATASPEVYGARLSKFPVSGHLDTPCDFPFYTAFGIADTVLTELLAAKYPRRQETTQPSYFLTARNAMAEQSALEARKKLATSIIGELAIVIEQNFSSSFPSYSKEEYLFLQQQVKKFLASLNANTPMELKDYVAAQSRRSLSLEQKKEQLSH